MTGSSFHIQGKLGLSAGLGDCLLKLTSQDSSIPVALDTPPSLDHSVTNPIILSDTQHNFNREVFCEQISEVAT